MGEPLDTSVPANTEGCAFNKRATRNLADIEADEGAGTGEQPVNHIRVNTTASYASPILV